MAMQPGLHLEPMSVGLINIITLNIAELGHLPSICPLNQDVLVTTVCISGLDREFESQALPHPEFAVCMLPFKCIFTENNFGI